MRRRLVLRLTFATAWAAALALVGMRLLALPAGGGAAGLSVSPWICECGGWSLLAMAQVVFCVLVADRVFPHANPWLSGIVELFAATTMTVGGTVVLVGWLAGR